MSADVVCAPISNLCTYFQLAINLKSQFVK